AEYAPLLPPGAPQFPADTDRSAHSCVSALHHQLRNRLQNHRHRRQVLHPRHQTRATILLQIAATPPASPSSDSATTQFPAPRLPETTAATAPPHNQTPAPA